MSSIPNGFPISLRSWSSTSKVDDPKNLPLIIQRINFERGGFQNITEESLRQEIADAESNDNGAREESSDEDEEDEPDRAKEVMAARDEILRQIEQAHSAAMLCTEVISAALTKEIPVQASASMSNELKELIGTGTLGMDKLHATRITSATKDLNKQVAKGWKIQRLNKSVDSILAAAERLKAEVEHETIFWGQVLAISDNNWAVCRLPYDKHTLGVQFGFSEASATFKNRSLGVLRRSEDGTITLDQGLANTDPQALRVRIRSGDIETGTSRIPRPVAEDAPVESFILEARNTIFAQELWLELNREARGLGAYGVRTVGDTLTFPLASDKTVILDLVLLEDGHSSGEDDRVAEGIHVAFSLLLTLAHRHNHRKRTQAPSVVTNEKQAAPPYNLLRPFLTRLKHQQTMSLLLSTLGPLCRALQSALPESSPSYTQKATILNRVADFPKPEQVLMRLTDSLEVITTFTITEDITMKIITRTHMSMIGSQFTVEVSPSLAELCPPPRPELPFTTIQAFREYMNYATACGLAYIMSSKPGKVDNSSPSEWKMTPQCNILKMTLPSQKSKQLAFSVLHTLDPLTSEREAKIRVTWEWSHGAVLHEMGGKQLNALMQRSGNDNVAGSVAENHGEGWHEWTSKMAKAWDRGEGKTIASLAKVMEIASKESS